MCKLIDNGILCKYKGKGKYDNYCFKHRREYLITDERIDINKYTNQCSDYLKCDILNTLFILKMIVYIQIGRQVLKNIYINL